MRKCFLLLLALLLFTGCTPAVPPVGEQTSQDFATAVPDTTVSPAESTAPSTVSPTENTSSDTETTAMPEVLPLPDTPLSIRYENRETFPYVNSLWAESWTEYGWLSGDGMSVSRKFSDIQAELPPLVYHKDWEILYQDGVSFLYVSIYSEDYERLHHNEELSVLDELSAGRYYLVITVKKQGDYIEASQKHESRGYECVFALEVSGS